MTAASGIIHEEFHSSEFGKHGGILNMVQLWVNLPASRKMEHPEYQAIISGEIPTVELADEAGSIRVIAGTLQGVTGPARTKTPMNVWDMRLRIGSQTSLPASDGWTTAIIVLKGAVRVNGGSSVVDAQMVLLDRLGEGVLIEADCDSIVLLLSGEPIDEPVAGYGPFVMNTQEEIAQAFSDYSSGRFGKIGSWSS